MRRALFVIGGLLVAVGTAWFSIGASLIVAGVLVGAAAYLSE